MRLRHGTAATLGLGILALASAATAQEQPPAPPVIVQPPVVATSPVEPLPPRPGAITSPRWLRQAVAEYPAPALANGVEGRVRLECVAGTNMRLTECRILHESPTGVGFGAAALTGAALNARVEPRTVDGVAVPARVAFNVDCRMGD